MNNKSDLLKNLLSFSTLGYLFFLFFLFIAIRDSSARILIADPSLYLFNLINSASFLIPADRYTSVINQGLVVLCVNLNLPLKLLIPVYSASFVLVRIFYFFLVNNVLKNQTAGFAIIAISVVGVADSYFRPTSESTIALLNSILLFAWLNYPNRYGHKWFREIKFIGVLVLILFGYFTHPIALFSLLFVLIYTTISKKEFKSIYNYIAVGVVLVLFLGKAFINPYNEHHAELYGNLNTSIVEVITSIREYYPYVYFFNHLKHLYILLIVLFFSSTILFYLKRRWILGTFLILYTCIYFIVTCVSFKQGDSDMQMEKIFLPLVLFSSIAFSSLFKSNSSWAFIPKVVILILIVFGICRITEVRPIYASRVEYVTNMVMKASKEGERKLVLRENEAIHKQLVFPWSLGVETLLISSMNNNMQSLTVFTCKDPEEFEEEIKQPDNYIVTPFQPSFNIKGFNSQYFDLPIDEYKIWKADIQ